MPGETELKLDVPAHRLGGVAKLGWLEKLAQAPSETETLVSVYFDTPRRALRDRHLALRVRRIGDKFLQTVKSGTSAVDREEWENEIADKTPERALVRATSLKHFTTKKRWRKLRPLFETKVQRTTIPLRYHGAMIELALDRGQVKAAAHVQPVSEVELELKDGDIATLAELARHLARDMPVALNLQSKAERGYALADGGSGQPVRASDVCVAAGQSAAEGFATIALSCLQHLTANRAAIMKGDPEGVHQMRVGLRRLRTALSLFKALLRGAETERIKENLKWLSEQLGPARDFDVFVKDEISRLERRDGRHAPLENLKRSLVARRGQAMARARKVVTGNRYRRIVLETGLWAIAGEWRLSKDEMQAARRSRSLPDMAGEILRQRTRKVTKKLARLEKMDARRRHKLRIAVKKLHYAVGFFGALYDRSNKAKKKFITHLKALQSALGRLNDIRVHEQFARKEVLKGKALQIKRAFGLGFVTGQERITVPDHIAAAAKAGRKFAHQSKYWR